MRHKLTQRHEDDDDGISDDVIRQTMTKLSLRNADVYTI